MSAHSLAPRVLGLAVGIATAACPTIALAQTGACCFPDDICFDGVDGTDCLLVDGRFLGDGLTCNGDPDGDSVFGCYDGCPLDREKDDPGVCGCGVPDDDFDADGVFDCVDLCPGTPPGMPVDESGCPPLGACCFLVGVCIDDTLPDDCFAVGGVHQGTGSTCGQECRFPGDGDVDGSGLVDLGDFWYWDSCTTGPLPGPLTEGCRPLDLNGDRAVDLADFAQFQRISFTCTHDGGCGDGVVCPETEECDDGNSSNTDGCLNSCRNAWCGDGFVWTGVEACDDGAMSDTCDADCTLSMCGDGFLNSLAGEQCDDGNNVDGDGCQGNCKNPVCGDDIVDPGESCDDGPNNDSGEGFCTAHCSAVQTCGDGVPNGTEDCDDGGTDDCGTCNADCTGAGTGSTCGDGIVCPETEACDDGYTDACGSCNVNCTAPGIGSTCGDGVVCPETEVCDDGGTDDCGPCKATCLGPGTGSVCGDGILCPETEVCDDGFTDPCGSCNADCTGSGTGSTCGDGIVCPETEACDDGNTTTGDGCDENCQAEAGLENDTCANPTPIGDGETSFSNEGATTDGPDEGGLCSFFDYSHIESDIWYCYEATCAGELIVSLCGSDYDTKMAIYAGCDCPNAAPIACSDDDCGLGFDSRITLQAQAGQSYLIRIGGFEGEQGSGIINILCGIDTCEPGAGDCFAAHEGRGCEDPDCCRTTCEADPFCCDAEWDDFCAGEAAGLCTGSFPACAAGAGSCASANGTPGCDEVECCNAVCMVDPFCCVDTWDGICAEEAFVPCRHACGGQSGGCFTPNSSPGCSDVECCEAVCDQDEFCCETLWDDACAALAATVCR